MITHTPLLNVSLIHNVEKIIDNRGYTINWFDQKELNFPNFVRENETFSYKNVLRGLHYQIRHPQGKLIRIISGKIYDVFVDLRSNSLNFGKWESVILSSDKYSSIYIPPGFAHGYYVMSESATIFYKFTDYYYPLYNRTIIWNDDTLKIDWPTKEPIISKNDLMGKNFLESEVYK